MKESYKKTLIISSEDIENIVVHIGMNTIMDQLIDQMRQVFTTYSKQDITIPVRSGFHYNNPELGLIEWMPLHEHGQKILVKMVGYHPQNPNKFHLPTIVSTISSYSSRTGQLKGIIDGVFLTALRTGAASAIASELMASASSKVLGLIGCGAQSITQLHALSRLFDFEEILYYDSDERTMNNFVERSDILAVDAAFKACSIDEIVSNADILCTATTIDIGEGPLFEALKTKPHLHVNAVGSDFPGKVELPLQLLKNSFVFPDFTEQAIREGECQQLDAAEIGADIFHCIQNQEKYSSFKNQLTVFDSTGLPLEDMVVADLFMNYAKELGLGTEIEIENIPIDAKNPYHFLKMGQSALTLDQSLKK